MRAHSECGACKVAFSKLVQLRNPAVFDLLSGSDAAFSGGFAVGMEEKKRKTESLFFFFFTFLRKL